MTASSTTFHEDLTVEWCEEEPSIIRCYTGFSGIVLEFSSDPLSPGFSPVNFNKCVRWLRAAGKPTPPAAQIGPFPQRQPDKES